MFQKKFRWTAAALLGLFCFLSAMQTNAGDLSPIGPSGGMLSSAANGVDDFLTGVQPPPGLYFLNYTFYYS